MATPNPAELVRERRARRVAARAGLTLWKARRWSTRGALDPWAISSSGRMVAGTLSRGGLTLDEVENTLRTYPVRDF